MTLTSLTEIKKFLKKLDEKRTNALKGSFDIDSLRELLASYGWYQVDENQMAIRERTDHDHLSVPMSHFVYKNKQRRSMATYQTPSKFIAVDHNSTELWYASERSTTMHFEEYMHFHLITFIRIDEPKEKDLKKLPVIAV